jgi:hypothetical protein
MPNCRQLHIGGTWTETLAEHESRRHQRQEADFEKNKYAQSANIIFPQGYMSRLSFIAHWSGQFDLYMYFGEIDQM